MQTRIDNVLDRVKEPETGLTIAQLGLVERVRYHENLRKLTVVCVNLKHNVHFCCTVMQGLMISSTLNAISKEFQKEFPDLSVEVV